mmetsp:Transcript_5754/g.9372  ORF Transcript_5754/g.9372 Transcript_5754/m.9372 type:complete len:120 (+) Transcript_5754:35-394(+)
MIRANVFSVLHSLSNSYIVTSCVRILSMAGLLLVKGLEDVPADPAQAGAYFLAAANQGDLEAAHQIGLCYWHGDGGAEKCVPEAIRWITIAAQGGHQQALVELQQIQAELNALQALPSK